MITLFIIYIYYIIYNLFTTEIIATKGNWITFVILINIIVIDELISGLYELMNDMDFQPGVVMYILTCYKSYI